MKKSKIVADVFRAVSLIMMAIFAVMLLMLLFVKGPSWSRVGKNPMTGVRTDGQMKTDTSVLSDMVYYNYVYGYYDGDPERAAKMIDLDYVTPNYKDGELVGVWVAPFEEAPLFWGGFFLSIYSGKNWCLQPAAQAARYTSWMVLFLILALISLYVWRKALKISRTPRTNSGRDSGRGRRIYRGSPIKRLIGWIAGVRSGRGSSRGRGREGRQ